MFIERFESRLLFCVLHQTGADDGQPYLYYGLLENWARWAQQAAPLLLLELCQQPGLMIYGEATVPVEARPARPFALHGAAPFALCLAGPLGRA